jgi:hypothetical protein
MILSLSAFTNVNQYHLYCDDEASQQPQQIRRTGAKIQRQQTTTNLNNIKDTTALSSEIVIPATTLLSRTAVYLSKLTILLNDMAKQPGLYIQSVQRYDKHILQDRQSPSLVNDIRALLVENNANNSSGTQKDDKTDDKTDDKIKPAVIVGSIQDEFYINWHSVLTLSPFLANPQLHTTNQTVTPLPTTLIHTKDELTEVLKLGDAAFQSLSSEKKEEYINAIKTRIQYSRNTLTISWITLLKQLSVILINHDVSVRSHTLSIFDKILLHYGLIWTKEEWDLIFDSIIGPIFDYVQCYHYNIHKLPLVSPIVTNISITPSDEIQDIDYHQQQQRLHQQKIDNSMPQIITDQNNVTSPVSSKLKKHIDKWIKTSLYAILLRLIHIYYYHHQILTPYLPNLLTILFKLIHTTNIDIIRIAFRTWYTLCTYPTTTSLTVTVQTGTGGNQTSVQQIVHTTKPEWDQLFIWYLNVCKHILPVSLISDETRQWLGLPAHKPCTQNAISMVSTTTLPSGLVKELNVATPSMAQVYYSKDAKESISPFVSFIGTVRVGELTAYFENFQESLKFEQTQNEGNGAQIQIGTQPQSERFSHLAPLLTKLELYNNNQLLSLQPSPLLQITPQPKQISSIYTPAVSHLPSLPSEYVLGTDLNSILSLHHQTQLLDSFTAPNQQTAAVKTDPIPQSSLALVTSSNKSFPGRGHINQKVDAIVYQQEMIILHSKVLLMMIDTVFNVFMTLYPPVFESSPFQANNANNSNTSNTPNSGQTSPNPVLTQASSHRQSLGLQLPPSSTVNQDGVTNTSNLTDQHLLCVLDSLTFIIDFANAFNSDYNLRKALWATGFLSSENNIVDLTAIVTRAMKISIRLIISRLCYKTDFYAPNQVSLDQTQTDFKKNLIHRLTLITQCTLPSYLLCLQVLQTQPNGFVLPTDIQFNDVTQHLPHKNQFLSLFPNLPKIVTQHNMTDKNLSHGLTALIDVDCCKVVDQVITELLLGILAHDELTVLFMANNLTHIYQLIALGTEPIRLLISKLLQTSLLSGAMFAGIQQTPVFIASKSTDLVQHKQPDDIPTKADQE